MNEQNKDGESAGGLSKELQEGLRRSIQQMYSAGSCPMCGAGRLTKMDAGARGRSFGEGNLLGAFMKSHRCNNCGYMA
jgi:predicted RNA-binding Zn-ribbon protein involved in translation (DUF1610 family)